MFLLFALGEERTQQCLKSNQLGLNLIYRTWSAYENLIIRFSLPSGRRTEHCIGYCSELCQKTVHQNNKSNIIMDMSVSLSRCGHYWD